MNMRYLLIFLVLACGCTLSDAYVAADKAAYDAIAPEYSAYVKGDASLSDDQKERRGRTLTAWEARIAEGASE